VFATTVFKLPYSCVIFQNERLLIHWAALGGHREIVEFLAENGSPVDTKDDVSVKTLAEIYNSFTNYSFIIFTVWCHSLDFGFLSGEINSCAPFTVSWSSCQ